jgi:hypothetical protein
MKIYIQLWCMCPLIFVLGRLRRRIVSLRPHSEILSQKKKKERKKNYVSKKFLCRAGDVAQVIEHLSSKQQPEFNPQ